MVDQFLRPASPGEAIRLKKQTGGVFLAGGTELNWKGAPSAETLISLEGVALAFVREEAGAMVLGPTITLQSIADDADLEAAGLGVLQQAARAIGSRPIRSLATLGGNIASNKSCSDLIVPLSVLGATVTLTTEDGDRDVPLDEYVAAPDRNALIAAVKVPKPGAATRAALERFSRSANDLALINAALALRLDGTTIHEPRLALGGVAATVIRVLEAEEALDGADVASGLDALQDGLAAAIAAAIHPIDDTRGSAAYKTDIAVELCRRTLLACVAEERS